MSTLEAGSWKIGRRVGRREGERYLGPGPPSGRQGRQVRQPPWPGAF